MRTGARNTPLWTGICCRCWGKKPETWKLEDYLRGNGHWKYYHQAVEPLVTGYLPLNYFLVLMIQRYL